MNDDEIFKTNEKLYTKLASYNEKYHLYSSNCTVNKSNSIDCKRQTAELDMEYEEVINSIKSLLGLIKDNNNLSSNKIDVIQKIQQNNDLRIKLQNDLDKLYFDKSQNNRHDIAIESGLLWIFLTTTCIYLVLFKL
jgi:hypothetical protein